MALAPARRSQTRDPSCALGPPHLPGKLARSWGAPRPLIWAQGWALRLCRAPSRAPGKEGGALGGCWACPWGGRCGCQGAAGWVVPAGHSSWLCGDSWDGQEEQKTPFDPGDHGVPGLDALSTMKQALASAPGCGPARPPALPGKPAGHGGPQRCWRWRWGEPAPLPARAGQGHLKVMGPAGITRPLYALLGPRVP